MATAQITKQKPRRNYDVDRRASILAQLDANGGNVDYTAKQVGIPRSSLRRLVQDAERDTKRAARVRQLRQEKRGELADALEDGCWEALQQARDRLPEASSRDAAVTFGIFNQNRMALKGMPTVIHATADDVLRNVTPAQLAAIRAVLAGEVPDTVDSPALSAGSASAVAGQAVEGDAERARDGCGGGEARVVTDPVQESGDGGLGDAGAARQLAGADALVSQDRAEARGEGVSG